FRDFDGPRSPGGQDTPNQSRGSADTGAPDKRHPGNWEWLRIGELYAAGEAVGDEVDQAARQQAAARAQEQRFAQDQNQELPGLESQYLEHRHLLYSLTDFETNLVGDQQHNSELAA